MVRGGGDEDVVVVVVKKRDIIIFIWLGILVHGSVVVIAWAHGQLCCQHGFRVPGTEYIVQGTRFVGAWGHVLLLGAVGTVHKWY